MRLFFSAGCPFAQRTRALLSLLDQPFEPRQIDLSAKPDDFLALSPTGAVPLLEEEGFVLYESAVINEYLAERFAWREAFSADLRQRARERLAMRRFDEVVMPAALASFKDPATLEAKPLWRKELEQLAQTMSHGQPRSLLGLHLAPHFLRAEWAFPDNPVVRGLREAAGGFVPAAAALPCVVATSPDREAVARLFRARYG